MGGGPLDGAMLDMVGEKVNIFGQKLTIITFTIITIIPHRGQC